MIQAWGRVAVALSIGATGARPTPLMKAVEAGQRSGHTTLPLTVAGCVQRQSGRSAPRWLALRRRSGHASGGFVRNWRIINNKSQTSRAKTIGAAPSCRHSDAVQAAHGMKPDQRMHNSSCTADDANRDGAITVDELVTAVNAALNRCDG